MYYGHGAKATAGQRVEVVQLRRAGASIRVVAERVFGDERFRGRVERILRAERLTQAKRASRPDPVLANVDFEAMDPLDLTQLLADRLLVRWAESEKPPSARELATLLDLQRRIDACRTIERLKLKWSRRRGG